MSANYAFCQASELYCCRFFRKARSCEKRIASVRSLKYISRNIGLDLISTSETLRHIRECCGHGDFLDIMERMFREQLPDFGDGLLEEEIFTTYLGMVLDAGIKGKRAYDRLYNCIPLLRYSRLLKHNSKKYMSVWEEYLADGNLADGNLADGNLLLDFAVCKMQVCHFSKLVDFDHQYEHDLGFLVSDLEKASACGCDIPLCLLRISDNIHPIENNVRLRMGLPTSSTFPTIRISTASYETGSDTDICEADVLLHFFEGGTAGNYTTDYMGCCFLDEEYESLREHISSAEIESLFKIAQDMMFPIFFSGKWHLLSSRTYKKSAAS